MENNIKTIEERAKEAGIICQYKSDYRYDKRSVEFGYAQGAIEQKDIDDNDLQERFQKALNEQKYDLINKSCKWLDINLHLFVMKGHINHSVLEQEFRKAMEE